MFDHNEALAYIQVIIMANLNGQDCKENIKEFAARVGTTAEAPLCEKACALQWNYIGRV